jgi:AraC-like DNA-binding protein
VDDGNYNIFNLIVISGVLQGILFSIFVLSQKKHLKNNTFFLGFVVLFLSLSNLNYWLIDTNLVNKLPQLQYLFIPWQWLVMPMFYFYVHRFLGKSQIGSLIKLGLLGPFTLVLCVHLVLFTKKLLNSEFEFPSHFSVGIYVYLDFLSVIFTLAVMYFSLRMILQYENDKTYNVKYVKSETRWLKRLIYIGLGICFLWLAALLVVIIFNVERSILFYPVWIAISALVYWIGYAGLNKSNQLRKRISLRKKRLYALTESTEPIIGSSNTFELIENGIKLKKLHTNPYLSLGLISEEFNLSEGYISQLFSKYSTLSFSDYINTLRIEDIKEMLVDSDFNNYTLLAIGLEAGFNSKTSFYSAFKKHTGKTPAEYKKEVQNS